MIREPCGGLSVLARGGGAYRSGDHCHCAVDRVGRCPHGSPRESDLGASRRRGRGHSDVADDRRIQTAGQRQCGFLRAERHRKLRDLRGRGRRRWQRGLHHRHPERRSDVVGLDSPSWRNHAVHRLVPVVSRLLRRRRCGHHEVERRRRELDDSGLVLPTSVDFLLHDRRMHGRRRNSGSSERRMVPTWNAQAAPSGLNSLSDVSCPRFHSPASLLDLIEWIDRR